jgi:hypothetical protein
VSRHGELPTSLLFPLLPIGFLFLLVGAAGGLARRALVKRTGRDLAVDAAGVCVLLVVGAGWGLAHPDNPGFLTVGVLLSIVAAPLTFVVIGAFTLVDAKPSAMAWVSYVVLGLLAFGLVLVGLLYWLGSMLNRGSLA